MISVAYIKVGIVIHIVFTVFMISNSGLLPIQEGGLFSARDIFDFNEGNFLIQLFSRFLFRGYAVLYIAGIVALLLLTAFKKILLDPLYNCCCKICCGGGQKPTMTQVADAHA